MVGPFVPRAPQSRCLIIAEAGVNHNGSIDRALRLVDAAVDAGADIVKFQTFKADRLVTRHARKAAYQESQTGAGDQYSMLKMLELSDDAHMKLMAHCEAQGIEFWSTAFDEVSGRFLIDLGIRRIKIPSGELTNAPFIRAMAAYGLPMIVSTGMATLEEVADAVGWIDSARRGAGASEPLADMLTLMHCTSSYPCPIGDVNLLAMGILAERFKLPVGYSDHTQGIFVAPLARAMGACVYEKHFTLDCRLPGPDHAASLEPGGLKQLVESIRLAEIILGEGIKGPTPAELEVRIAARRSLTLVRDVRAGQHLSPEDLGLMRPGDGIPPAMLEQVIGCIVCRDKFAGDTLRDGDLS